MADSQSRNVWRAPMCVTDNSEALLSEYSLDEFMLTDDLPPLDRRQVVVTWKVDGAVVQARLMNSRGAVVVDHFALDGGDGGLPAAVRRLPSDRAVIRVVQQAGKPARSALRWLLGTPHGYVTAGRALLAQGRTLDSSLLEDALDQHLAEITRRPRSRVTAEVTLAKELLREQEHDESVTTASIISRLVAQDITEATAWRRLRVARHELSS